MIDLNTICMGMPRDEVRSIFGEPDAVASTTRKYRVPMIYKYGDIELTFGAGKNDGLLYATRVDSPTVHVRLPLQEEMIDAES